MQGGIPEDQIQQVREATDLVELVGREVELKRKASSFWGLCPFHVEKTPSFKVDPAGQFYKCHGCGKGGNAFSWLQERLGFTFPEAVRHLARDAGIEIVEARRRENRPDGPSRERILEVLEWATRGFERLLGTDDAGSARDYLLSRGFEEATLTEFRIGWSHDSWDALLEGGRRAGFDVPTLEAAGLVVRQEETGRVYDRFRGRILFPIADVTGRIRAFGARAMGDAQPKYLNSPEGPLFQKAKTLFGLPQAREAMQKGRRAVLVEGYTDVMMAHQVGVREVVAGLGTALTRENAAQIRRFADGVVLVYDGDGAGRAAALRALGAFLEEEIAVRVAFLPDGRDPCDVARNEGAEGFRRRIEAALDAPAFLAETVRSDAADGTSESRAVAAKNATETIRAARDPIQRADLVRAVAEALRVRESSILERLKLSRPRRVSSRGEGDATATSHGPRRPAAIDAEHWAIQAALFDGSRWERLAVAPLRGHASRNIVRRAIALRGQDEDGPAVAALLAGIGEDEANLVTDLAASAEGRDAETLTRQFEDCIRRIETAVAPNRLAEQLGLTQSGSAEFEDTSDHERSA